MKKLLVTLAICTGLSAYANDSLTVVNTQTENNPQSVNENAYTERKISAITETGMTYMFGKPAFNIYQAVGIKVNPYLFIGEGVGIQIQNTNQWQFQLLTDMRVHALNKWVTPTFTLQAGLNKTGNKNPVNEKTQKILSENSMSLNAGTGVLFRVKENASFSLTGGYSLISDFKTNFNGGFVKFAYLF